MANANNEKLEGITLNVYMYVVKKGKPVGPRDVMKGAQLSSPSVAYRHLQKLEDLGYVQKDRYGEYVIKDKAHVRGYIWLGKRMMPKMLFYTLIFLTILIVELIVLAIHYSVENYMFKIFFLLLTLITGFAMAVFAVEALRHHRTKTNNQKPKTITFQKQNRLRKRIGHSTTLIFAVY